MMLMFHRGNTTKRGERKARDVEIAIDDKMVRHPPWRHQNKSCDCLQVANSVTLVVRYSFLAKAMDNESIFC